MRLRLLVVVCKSVVRSSREALRGARSRVMGTCACARAIRVRARARVYARGAPRVDVYGIVVPPNATRKGGSER